MSKYHNRKIETDYGVFHSEGEYHRFLVLKKKESNGMIKNLQRQVKYELIPTLKGEIRTERKVTYVADFVYEENGKTVVEDYKGIKTKDYIIKRKLMLYKWGVEILETK